MSLFPTSWRSFHLLLAALLAFLVILISAALLLLRYSAMQPSVRQLAQPLISVLVLVDAQDAGSSGTAVLARLGMRRASAPPATVEQLPVPFLEALASYLQAHTGRMVVIERGADDGTRLWLQTARGDYLGVPLESMRTLVARFALLIVLIALALALLAAWWLARRLTAPIEQLAALAARLPEPVAAEAFRVHGSREIELLGDRLAAALERIALQRRERDLLLAGLSHDLRTPLMRLLLRIDLLESIPEVERSALAADIGELDRRIDRFIEHARTGAEEPSVALDFAQRVAAEIQHSRERGHDWQASWPAHAWLRGQPGVLARLLANLIDNAEQHGAAPMQLDLRALDAASASGWLLTISNGRRAAISGAATHRGFGLALCTHIAQTHGGKLTRHETADCFRVELWLPAPAMVLTRDSKE